MQAFSIMWAGFKAFLPESRKSIQRKRVVAKVKEMLGYTPHLSDQMVNQFLERHGKNGAKVIESLSKKQSFHKAIQSPIGQELLIDGMIRLEDIQGKMFNESASKQELAEFRAMKYIVGRWSGMIALRIKQMDSISSGG